MSEAVIESRRALRQWLSRLESLHPKEIELGLERVKQVADRLKLTEFGAAFGTHVVTVSGTNGKGSSIAALEAIYVDAGYKVGAYTSPHLMYYNERIRINGKTISDKALLASFEAVDAARQGISLTYFEFGTLAALYLFKHFKAQGCEKSTPLDIILLEVGLGGRLDAVNIVDADVALITSIGVDHQDWLGETREEIGFEKAGIMRQGQGVVIGESHVPNTVLAHAKKLGLAPFLQGQHFGVDSEKADQSWDWFGLDKARNKLLMRSLPSGGLLLANLAGVLQVCQLIPLGVSRENLERGLSARVAGRQECIEGEPVHVFDVAHNADALKELARYLSLNPIPGDTYAVFGMLADKRVMDILQPLSTHVDHWITCALPVKRTIHQTALAQMIMRLKLKLSGSFSSPGEAYQHALSLASGRDRILVFGSFYTVSAVKQAMLSQRY